MRALSLFSGIGGIDLALAQTGISTDVFCDWEPFCQDVLSKRFAGAKVYGDVTQLCSASLAADGVLDHGFDVVSGGFPCQPASVAGKRAGKLDERYLWPEMFRVIREVRPRCVLGENVRGLFSVDRGEVFGDVVSDLSSEGYAVGWACYGAGDVGAVHPRDRVFILGVRPEDRLEVSVTDLSNAIAGWLAFDLWPAPPGFFQHSYEPPRVAPRTKNRAARLKALGNAVVPQQAFAMAAAMVCCGDRGALDFSWLDDVWRARCAVSRNFDSKLRVISDCFTLVASLCSPAPDRSPHSHIGSDGKWHSGAPSLLPFMAGNFPAKWPLWGFAHTNGVCYDFKESEGPPVALREQFPTSADALKFLGEFSDGDYARNFGKPNEELWRTPQASEAGARVETLYDSDGNPATTGRRAYRKQPDGQLVLQSVTINQQVEMWERREEAPLWATPQAETTAGELPEHLVNRGGESPLPGEKFFRRESGRVVQSALTTQVKMWPGERWATPTAQDGKNCGGASQHSRNSKPLNAQVGDYELPELWPTPRTSGTETFKSWCGRWRNTTAGFTGMPLLAAVEACQVEPYEPPTASGQWPTPNASVAQDGERAETWKIRREKLKVSAKNGNGAGMPLTIAVQQGEPRVGPPPRLNPDWVDQLMGVPVGWTDV